MPVTTPAMVGHQEAGGSGVLPVPMQANVPQPTPLAGYQYGAAYMQPQPMAAYMQQPPATAYMQQPPAAAYMQQPPVAAYMQQAAPAPAPVTYYYVQALYDFTPSDPSNDSEVALRRGDVLQLIEQGQDGWWEGVHMTTGQRGLFPGSHVQFVS